MIFEVAHQMGLLPLTFVAALHLSGRKRDAAWWWLAGAFGVSWLADWAAHWAEPFLTSLVYLVSQAAIIGAVLLPRREALGFVAVLVTGGLLAIVLGRFGGPDIFLHTVAFGSVTGLVYRRPALGLLARSLLVTFGLGLVCWWAYALIPGWTTWGAYQAVRLTGLLLFCSAALWPAPRLRLA